MSRRSITKKRYPKRDAKYDSTLVSLFITRILRNGKKTLANSIVLDTFDAIETQTNTNPIQVFETSIKNVIPLVEVKARRIGGSTYQVPVEVRPVRRNALGMRWMVDAARKRGEKSMAQRLAAEMMDAQDNKGSAVKKREDVHRMAEANKAFAHYRW